MSRRGGVVLALLPALLGRAEAGVTSAGGCLGDCDRSRFVTVDELVLGVAISVGGLDFRLCRPFDRDDDTTVEVDELIGGVGNALAGRLSAHCRADTDRDADQERHRGTLPELHGDAFRDAFGASDTGRYVKLRS